MATPKFLHEFTISVPREVDETNTRVEDGKTITETIKVKRTLNIAFGFKKPNRVEAFNAELERSVWETKFVTAGILPQALLLKVYANHGGILSNEDTKYYNQLQADLLITETDLKRLQVTEPEKKEEINTAALKLMTLRDEIINFQQKQSVFFANTSEAKAREKLIEWLVLYMTYYRPVNEAGEPGDWKPFFEGKTTEDKLTSFDNVADRQDELWLKAKDMIELIATLYASNGSVDSENLALYAEEIKTL